jgi:F-type H+-transporting ATPase subunit delta
VATATTLVSDIAGRYATALFELARDQDGLDAVAGDVATIRAAIAESADLRRLVSNPIYDAKTQSTAMAAVLAALGVGTLVANFVGVVAGNRRLFALDGMALGFQRLLSRHRGEVVAEVTSAWPLDEGQTAAVRTELTAAMRTEVSVAARVDPNILGGLIVKIGSRMIDSSLRTKLRNLRFAMKGVE